MTYSVRHNQEFDDNVSAQVDYLFAQQVSTETVEKWLTELFEVVGALDEMPRRFAVDEIQTERAGYEVRKLNFGSYLIFYRVFESERVVELIHLRHGARQRGI